MATIIDELTLVIIAEVDRAIASLSKAEDAAKKTKNSFKDLAKQIAGLTTVYDLAVDAGKATIRWLKDSAVQAVSLAASFEQARMAFGAMLGDMEKGTPFFAKLQQFAYTTPLSVEGTSKAAQTLLGFGVEADRMIDTLSRLGDAARGNDERLAHLALVYGQVKAQTRALTQDLYQFVNSGVPIFQLLADSMGVTTKEIKAMAPEGKLTFEEIDKALRKATDSGGLFYGMMDAMAASTQGQWQIAMDNWQYSLSKIGALALPLLTQALNAFNDSFIQTNTNMERFGATVGTMASLKAFENYTTPEKSTTDLLNEKRAAVQENIRLAKEMQATSLTFFSVDAIAASKARSEFNKSYETRNFALLSEIKLLEQKLTKENELAALEAKAAQEAKGVADYQAKLAKGIKAGKDAYAEALAKAWQTATLEGRKYLTLQDFITIQTAQYTATIKESEGTLTGKSPRLIKIEEEIVGMKDFEKATTETAAANKETEEARKKFLLDVEDEISDKKLKAYKDLQEEYADAAADALKVEEAAAEERKKFLLDTEKELSDAKLDMYKALQKEYADADKKEAERKQKELEKAEDAYQRYTSAIGEALVSGEEGWEKYNKIVRGGIADMIEAFGKEAMFRAGIQFATGNWAGGAALVAAAGVAFAGSAAVRAMAQGGEGTVTKPTLFLAGEAGPEDYSFRPKSKGGLGASPIIINQYIAGSVLAERQLGELAVGAVAKARRGY